MSNRYSYKLIPLNLAIAIQACSEEPKPDSFLSDDADAQMIREVLEGGYRWVHNIADYAVFEKEVAGIDARQFARDMIGAIDEMHMGVCRCEGAAEIICPVCKVQDMLGPLAGVEPIVEEGEGVDA